MAGETLLHCGRMPLEDYLEQEIPVYLGTESLASAPTLDVRDDLQAAIDLHAGHVAPEAIQAMAERPLAIP